MAFGNALIPGANRMGDFYKRCPPKARELRQKGGGGNHGAGVAHMAIGRRGMKNKEFARRVQAIDAMLDGCAEYWGGCEGCAQRPECEETHEALDTLATNGSMAEVDLSRYEARFTEITRR